MLPSAMYCIIACSLFVGGFVLLPIAVHKDNGFLGFLGILSCVLCLTFTFFTANSDELTMKDYEWTVKKLAEERESCSKFYDEDYCLIKNKSLIKDSIYYEKRVSEIINNIKEELNGK